MTESEALREWRKAHEAFIKAKARLIQAESRLLEPPRQVSEQEKADDRS